ncbi:MAG: chemotaxis response regulator protein-glutamate methylesterase [Nitrososphaera sp.]|nr:chemotaxis response regulator protein-glutamate methylesterase [Nitrososphaera sp.]
MIDHILRVMVVNDSTLVREWLSGIIRSHPKFELCGTARNGDDAMEKVGKMNPHVILLDLEMPNMDGITFIEKLMAVRPTAVVVVSAYGGSGISGDIVFESLDAGAVDFISIPPPGLGLNKLKDDLIERIETAGMIDTHQLMPRKESPRPAWRSAAAFKSAPTRSTEHKVVVIGASTGGPRLITQIFSSLPESLPASILVVVHISASFTKSFAQHLSRVSKIKVKEASDGEPLEDGTAYVAPGDYHMSVTKDRTIRLTKGPKIHGVRPSINISMISASEVFGPNIVGTLLTGMGQDGAFGMKMIKRRGGKTIAQDKSTSIVYGMPKAAVELGAVDEIVPAHRIASAIVEATGDIEEEVLRGVS